MDVYGLSDGHNHRKHICASSSGSPFALPLSPKTSFTCIFNRSKDHMPHEQIYAHVTDPPLSALGLNKFIMVLWDPIFVMSYLSNCYKCGGSLFHTMVNADKVQRLFE